MLDFNGIIKCKADEKIAEILENGFALAGVNGPYGNQDTPLRNSAHWAMTYTYLYKCGYIEYKTVIDTLIEYFLAESNYGANSAPICRLDENTDDTNGIIGPAWLIESMIYLSNAFNNRDLYKKAIAVFESQTFNEEESAWNIVDSNGTNWGMDKTFNHQLWFAASGLMILNSDYAEDKDKIEQIGRNITLFLSSIPKRLKFYKNGLFCHTMYPKSAKARPKYYIKKVLRYYSAKSKRNNKYSQMYELECGYLDFDLYGFALIKKYNPEFMLFEDYRFKKAVALGTSFDFLSKMGGTGRTNQYAFPYNSPAYEYPFIAKSFLGEMTSSTEDKFLQIHYAAIDALKSGQNEKNERYDRNTSEARIYEWIHFLDD